MEEEKISLEQEIVSKVFDCLKSVIPYYVLYLPQDRFTFAEKIILDKLVESWVFYREYLFTETVNKEDGRLANKTLVQSNLYCVNNVLSGIISFYTSNIFIKIEDVNLETFLNMSSYEELEKYVIPGNLIVNDQ